MFIGRLIVGGLIATGTVVVMVIAGLEMPEDLGDFVWQGPIVSAAGIALAGYGLWKFRTRKKD